jgi:hypothetical protein
LGRVALAGLPRITIGMPLRAAMSNRVRKPTEEPSDSIAVDRLHRHLR